MGRCSGDSYFVLVNSNGDIYEQEDPVTGYTYVVDFDTEEDAKFMLEEFIDLEELNPDEGWHVERHRW